MKAFSLFSGIGGFDLALRNLNHEIVGACEIDEHARQIYGKHFDEPKYRDATKIQEHQLPDFDILCAGFPCQAFSVAGKRLGFEESRGTLFFEIVRIAAEVRPRFLLLENVKGLLSHDNGKTFANILAALDECGYDAQWQVLNSKYWVPQNRERIFIIGYLREEPRPKVFPIAPPGEVDKRKDAGKRKQLSHGIGSRYGAGWQKHSQETYITNAIDSNYWKGTDKHGQRTLVQVGNVDKKGHNSLWGRVYDTDGIASNLNAEGGGLGAKTGLYAVPIKFLNRNQKNMPKEQAMTVDTHNSSGITDGMAIRKLTPLECERLQGFPDGWTEGISDTQRYRCLGNAVTVPVVEFILQHLS